MRGSSVRNEADVEFVESGLLVFKLIEGEFAYTDCYLEVLMDDQIFASYSSSKIRSKHTVFNEGKTSYIAETCNGR